MFKRAKWVHWHIFPQFYLNFHLIWSCFLSTYKCFSPTKGVFKCCGGKLASYIILKRFTLFFQWHSTRPQQAFIDHVLHFCCSTMNKIDQFLEWIFSIRSDTVKQGCAIFFVAGPYNQPQTSSWVTRKKFTLVFSCTYEFSCMMGKNQCWQGPQ